MRNRRILAAMAAAGALALSAGSAFADATVSKNPADGADFDTIAAALASVGAGETVTVLDDATYVENVVTLDNRHLVSTNGATVQARFVIQGAGLESSLVGFTVVPNGGQNDAILFQAAATFLLQDTVIDSTAPSGDYTRDGIRLSDPAVLTIRNSQIRGVGGDGIFTRGAANGYSIVIEDSTFEGTGSFGINLARTGSFEAVGLEIRDAGGLAGIQVNAADVSIRLESSLIESSVGEGIRVSGANLVLDMVDTDIIDNGSDGILTRSNNAANATITIEGGEFSGNLAGIRCNDPAILTIGGGAVFTGNRTFGIGFAQSSQGSTGTFADMVVTNNAGHGLAINRAGDYTIENLLIEGNTASGINRDFNGGDTLDSTVVVRDSIIRNNNLHGITVIADGGDIDLLVEDCLIEGNGSRCIWVDDKFFAASPSGQVRATIQRNILVNTSKSIGPDPEDPDGPDVILGWNWNTYLWNTLPGTVVVNNVFDQGYAGLFINRGSVDVHHNTIVNNRSDTDALIFEEGGDAIPTAGIAIANILAGETVDIRNNIIANSGIGVRTALEPGFDGNPPSAPSIDGTLAVDFNLTFARPGGTELEAGLPGVGLENILGADPAFIAPSDTAGAGNYSIFGGSPAINAGTDLGVLEDILGNPRPLEGVPDMGAYEVMSDPSTVGDWSLHAY